MRIRGHGRMLLSAAVAVGLAVAAAGSVAAGSEADEADEGDDTTPAGTVVGGTDESSAPAVDEACIADGLEALVAAAQEEGELTVYSSQGLDNLNRLAELFEAEYDDIDVEIVRDVDATAIARVEAEQETGRHAADLMVSAAPAWVAEKGAEGWFAEPTGPQFTCESDYDTEAYVHDDGVFEVSSVVFTFAWNTDHYPDGLTDYPDLLDPELAGGRIGVVDPSISPVLADYYAWLDETYGDTFVADLAEQEPRIYTSGGAMQEALIAGEIIAGSYIAPVPSFVEAIDDGAPVDFAIPDALWGAKFFGTIIADAPNPNAAQLFANFMVTMAGQEPIHSGGAVIADVPGALATNEQVRDVDLEGQQPEALSAFIEEWDALFR
ncbi:ABC transporter substrate-binding protein [Desertimonas flava]|uniref:ABC transporter substrate-binding protein n=1 Tax=Desertimonas flava TaxID=2064846 RepID=UPI0013C3EF27|nr:extracellular solute-binding protein [Desertimonas flava]